MSKDLISAQNLFNRLGDKNSKIIDVSVKKVIAKEPIIYHSSKPIPVIPDSYFLDLVNQLTDNNSPELNHFPKQNQVAQLLNNFTIEKNNEIIIYDNQGIYSAPRVWYILQSYGFKNSVILDGGLPEWIKQGYPTTNQYLNQSEIENHNLGGVDSVNSATDLKINLKLNLNFNQAAITTKDEILEGLNNQEMMVIDVRSTGRFLGIESEPRKGMRSGHIPHSVNLPFGLLFDGNRYKTKEQLQKIFAAIVKNKNQLLVFSCGSGMTACIALFAAKLAGYENLSLYDGSWSEWGSDPSTPIEQ